MSVPLQPLLVVVANDFPVVVAGVASLLRPSRARVRVAEHTGEFSARSRADVVLYDPFGRANAADRLREIRRATDAKVLVYAWAASERQIDDAIRAGASGYLPKTVDGDRMVAALFAVVAGETVRGAASPQDDQMVAWPGQTEGLTARESEILAMIVAGLSNQEIAGATYLSINSIKTHVRTAYRKMGVDSRSRALLWGIHHGFQVGPTARVVARGQA